jgi:hypothetical protein
MAITGKTKEGLNAQKIASLANTRRKLQDALHQLSESLLPGALISINAVAKAAGVDRSTIYRYHLDFIREIQGCTDPGGKSKFAKPQTRVELTHKQVEYKALTAQAQKEVLALARINYQLDVRILELEAALQARDKVIVSLKNELNKPKNSHSISTISVKSK